MQIRIDHLVGIIMDAAKHGETHALQTLSSIMKHHYNEDELAVIFEKMSLSGKGEMVE